MEELLRTLERLAREQGLTLVLLGQDLRLARNCSRLVLLHQGEVLADGAPSQVLRQVELFRQLGLQVPELPGLFHDLGQDALPLSLDEAEAQARSLGWGVMQRRARRPPHGSRTREGISHPLPNPPPSRGRE